MGILISRPSPVCWEWFPGSSQYVGGDHSERKERGLWPCRWTLKPTSWKAPVFSYCFLNVSEQIKKNSSLNVIVRKNIPNLVFTYIFSLIFIRFYNHPSQTSSNWFLKNLLTNYCMFLYLKEFLLPLTSEGRTGLLPATFTDSSGTIAFLSHLATKALSTYGAFSCWHFIRFRSQNHRAP